MKGWDGKPLAPELVEEIRRLEAMSDDTIDYSDIPKVTDFSGFKRREEWEALGRYPLGRARPEQRGQPAEMVEQAKEQAEPAAEGQTSPDTRPKAAE